MEILNQLFESFERYFCTLGRTGYYNAKDRNKLLLYAFIVGEFLYGQFSCYIDDEAYNKIMKALSCLWGTCLLPYPQWRSLMTESWKRRDYSLRISEDRILRSTQDANLRQGRKAQYLYVRKTNSTKL